MYTPDMTWAQASQQLGGQLEQLWGLLAQVRRSADRLYDLTYGLTDAQIAAKFSKDESDGTALTAAIGAVIEMDKVIHGQFANPVQKDYTGLVLKFG